MWKYRETIRKIAGNYQKNTGTVLRKLWENTGQISGQYKEITENVGNSVKVLDRERDRASIWKVPDNNIHVLEKFLESNWEMFKPCVFLPTKQYAPFFSVFFLFFLCILRYQDFVILFYKNYNFLGISGASIITTYPIRFFGTGPFTNRKWSLYKPEYIEK